MEGTHWVSGSNLNIEVLLDARADIFWTPPKWCCGPPVSREAYKRQIMDVFAQVHMWWPERIPEPITGLFPKFQNAELQQK